MFNNYIKLHWYYISSWNFLEVSTIPQLKHVHSSLTLSRRRPLSYRNQSTDLLRKSMDWFLYDNGLRLERVKSSVEKELYSNSLNELQLQRLSIIVAHSSRELIYVGYGLQWHRLIGTCRLLLLTIDCIQLRQGIWVLAWGKWADFSPSYIVGKMYELRTL